MKIILLIILFLAFYECAMSQEEILKKATSCYAIRKIVPESRKDIGDVKLEKFVLYDICLDEKSVETQEIFIEQNGITKAVKTKLIKTFKNGIEAQKFAEKHKIADSDFPKINDCQIIRIVNMPISLTGKKVENAKAEIVLLNTCIMREKAWEVLPKIKLTRNGKDIEREYWDIKTFKNRSEAEEYARQNGLTDVNFNPNITAMNQEKISDCRIIRIVEIPMTKKPNVPTESKIALLNTCLNDKIPQQRPIIEVIRNGKKEFREFEIIKVFADKIEAEKYAQENDIKDISFVE